MKIERAWAMPNKNTFDIKPIYELIKEEMVGGVWIDPFANKNKLATITNDLNPEFNTDYHLDALDFLKQLKTNSAEGVLYDPPFSPRQIQECYKNFGIKCGYKETSAAFWSEQKSKLEELLKVGVR